MTDLRHSEGDLMAVIERWTMGGVRIPGSGGDGTHTVIFKGRKLTVGEKVEVVPASWLAGAVEALRAIRERLRAAEAPDSDVLTAHDIADDWLGANARGQ